jgi:hypothetical protein
MEEDRINDFVKSLWYANSADEIRFILNQYEAALRQSLVSGSACKHDLQFKKMGQVGRKVLKCSKCGFIAS